MSLVDKPQIAVLTFKEAWRRLRRRLRTGPIHHLRFVGMAPERLALVPPTLHQGDPFVAEAIYGGRFHLAGRLVEAGRGSIFQMPAPSPEFAAELHGFSWLCHHAAIGDALAAQNARALVSDWLRHCSNQLSGPAFEPEVAARRLIAFLVNADLLLGSAQYDFYRRFLKSLTSQTRYLRSIAPEAPAGLPRLMVRMALVLSALCLPLPPARARAAVQHLADELDLQILPDGGHSSRNPAAVATILAELLPIRETLLSNGQPVPKGIYSAIDRMLPALRFFRHADGTLALFNGTGASDMRLMTTLTRFDETLGEPLSNARHSGYRRLACGGTVVIADTGCPPQVALSRHANAGTLAFELSSETGRIVVNCGTPQAGHPDLRRLSRSTAAHSTVTVGDRSSSRFAAQANLDRFLGSPLVPGPTMVEVNDLETDGPERAIGFEARHDGYERDFGFVHMRRLELCEGGRKLVGRDRLVETRRHRGYEEAPAAAVRFHLHPQVSVETIGDFARLSLRGQIWRFTADQPVTVEDSILFADSSGSRRTLQLVLTVDPVLTREIVWAFERLS
ncbi:heparinase II/III family protein [Jiella mangrovi]|uniref:Heparinase II/III family protein n=1 Tax=Jiella mangrovi TaxID=2821407 RepID=A0ABS4BK79_9HYPH|nr:heparinase II/III family protein [Jiella mangrovi]MBP0617140.1 heparinase II/III family protein [Jiella mangrovi]